MIVLIVLLAGAACVGAQYPSSVRHAEKATVHAVSTAGKKIAHVFHKQEIPSK